MRGRCRAAFHQLQSKKIALPCPPALIQGHAMKDDDESVRAATLGEFLGISARAVSDLSKRGIAVKSGPGRWRLRESVSRYCDDLRRQAKGKGGESAAVIPNLCRTPLLLCSNQIVLTP